MLRLRLLHSILKASFLLHTLKTLTKRSIKLNGIFLPLSMSQAFSEISFTIYVNAA